MPSGEILKAFLEDGLWEHLKRMDGGFYLDAALDPQRPYDGQPHTADGERGRTIVERLTMRDLMDCYIIGCYQSAPIEPEEYPETIFDLPWGQIDPMAVAQNMLCEVERRMGIFPNVPDMPFEIPWVEINDA